MSFRTCCVLMLGFFCASSAVIAHAPSAIVEAKIAAIAAPPTPEAVAAPDATVAPVATLLPDSPAPDTAPQAVTQSEPPPPPERTPPPIKLAMNAIVLPVASPAPVKTRSATRSDVDALRGEMHGALAGVLLPDAAPLTHAAISAAHALMQKANTSFDTLQVVLLVDRSPKVQRLWVTIVEPGSTVLEPLGSVRVSTGKPGRKEHFRTPVGVFFNDAAILGYRALGTYNENHIRGNGVRGMRVWDFGWQTTDDWRTPRALMAVRMEMHATDPSVLEQRLGRWDSEGCIRIPSRFDSFLDVTGLIDAREREAAREDRRFAALLLKHTVPNALAGRTVVVVDTSEPDAAPSDPVRAQLIAHPNLPTPDPNKPS